MKRKFSAICLLLLFLFVCTLLYGCKENKECTFIISNGDEITEIVVDLNKDEFKDKTVTVYDVLKSKEYSDVFKAEIVESDSPFLTNIYGINPNSQLNEFIGLYSTLESFKYEDFTKTVNGILFYSSSVGINQLTVVEGNSYLFSKDTW